MKIKIPQQFQFLFQPRRTKIMFSGRAAAKSWSIAQALMVLGVKSKLRILCTREFQNSITDSVHKLLSDINDKFNLGYEVTNNSITHPVTGTEFMFYGLKTNITKIKSLEAVDICWVEEAETISERSLEVLIPTIRKEGSEIWYSFNPFDESDAVYKQFVVPHLQQIADGDGVYADANIYILKTSYDKNPFLPKTIRKEIEAMKLTDYVKYQHIYEGLPVGEDENCIIKPEWFDAAIDAHIKLNFKARGVKVIGFDPADEGNDSKAMVYRYGPVVEQLIEWNSGNLEEAVDRVYNKAQELRVQEIVYDGIGIGAGAKIKFNSYDPNATVKVNSFIGGAKPDNPNQQYKEDMRNNDVFRNKRAQYYWLLRDRFEATYRAIKFQDYTDPEEMISISSDCEHISKLKSELTKIQRKRSGNTSMIQIESKADMRSRGMRSPNIADSLVYCFADEGIEEIFTMPVHFASEW